MAKQKKQKENKLPENDKNNVAYYKKKIDVTLQNEEKMNCTKPSLNLSNTKEYQDCYQKEIKQATQNTPTPPSKSWSQIAGENVNNVASNRSIQKTNPTIKPEFESESSEYDRIVVVPTHFNNKPFKGFISNEEANVISMAIGLDNLDNLHGTSFYRSEEGVLFITFKLKRNMSIQDINDSVHQFFWFDKESKAGNTDKISGQVVHPPMLENNSEMDDETVTNYTTARPYIGSMDNTKEIKIDGCNYELSKSEITSWIKLYGEIKSELEEIAITGDTDGSLVGTGSYTVKVKLRRLIPNVIPMQGLKVKCSYQGVKKQCSNCYDYHKLRKDKTVKRFECTKTTFQEYKETFKVNNPGIPLRMMGMAAEEDDIDEDNNSEMANTNMMNNDEIDNEDTYFNYNYSYDFAPNWLKDARDQQTINTESG